MCSIALFVFLFLIPILTSEHVPEQYVRREHIKVGLRTLEFGDQIGYMHLNSCLVDITNDE